jgi:hypothetical protein
MRVTVIVILILSTIQVVPNDWQQNKHNPVGTASAGASWIQRNYNDFKNGEANNVSVIDELRLDKYYKFNNDNFEDDSKIAYKINAFINTTSKAVEFKQGNTFIKRYEYNSSGVGYSLQNTSDGNFIICGSVDVKGQDMYGNEIWNRTYGGQKNENGKCVKESNDGGFVMVGFTKSYSSNSYADLWLVKTDSAGVEQWNKTYGGDNNDIGYSLDVTSDGGYILTGYSVINSSMSVGALLIKTDSNGNEEWNKTFDGNDSDVFHDVRETLDKGFITVGWTQSFRNGYADVWAIKTDKNGTVEWNKTYGSWAVDSADSVALTSDGGYIICGTANHPVTVINNYLLLKINSTGHEQWNKTFGGSTSDFGNTAIQTNDGGYILTGGSSSYGGCWVIKTNATGIEQWNRTYGSNMMDDGYALLQLEDNEYMILGQMIYNNDGKCHLIRTDMNGNVEDSGYIYSINLYPPEGGFVCYFTCTAYVPSDSIMKIQFSNDNITWYNSTHQQDKWEGLQNGKKSFNLTRKSFESNKFYYKIVLTTDNQHDPPSIQNINLTYAHYYPSGEYESQPYDSGSSVLWKTLTHILGDIPGTTLKMQLRTGVSEADLFLKSFVGPDGKESSYYTTSNTEIWTGHDHTQWIQYKVYFSTNNGTKTPLLDKVTIYYNIEPGRPILSLPANNTS